MLFCFGTKCKSPRSPSRTPRRQSPKKSLNQAVNQLFKIGQRRPLTLNEANALVKALNAQHKLMNIAFKKTRNSSFRTPTAP